MTGGLFLLEVIGFYLVAYWAYANEVRPEWRGLDRLFGMKAGGSHRPAVRRQALWRGLRKPGERPLWWRAFVSWPPPNWRGPSGTAGPEPDDPDR